MTVAKIDMGAVLVVEDLDNAGLLRPVDVRGGIDLPEAPAAGGSRDG
jgi:hypothetical protein